MQFSLLVVLVLCGILRSPGSLRMTIKSVAAAFRLRLQGRNLKVAATGSAAASWSFATRES